MEQTEKNERERIVDIHTHSFPENLAKRAVEKLALQARARAYSDGTVTGLAENMRRDFVSVSVLQPVATKPSQTRVINENAVRINEAAQMAEANSETEASPKILSFGGVHPDNENYREELRFLAEHGVKGVKLHPAYQGVFFNDMRYLRIMDCAWELGLFVLVHAGYDVGMPDCEFATLEHILPVLDGLCQEKLILAHMAGFGQWDKMETYICGSGVLMDTAYSLLPITPLEGSNRTDKEDIPMSKEQFCRVVKKHGAHRILFGTDSPWDTAGRVADHIKSMGLPQEDVRKILWQNAAEYLGI